MEFLHKSVLLESVLDNLITDKNGIYVDGTLGGAGHTLNLLKRLEHGTVIGIDRDEEALAASEIKLEKSGYHIRLVHDNFNNIKQILADAGIEKISGALLDLGVSSYQIDNPDRGFAYMGNAPLDMRMDKSQYLNAYNVVNEYSEWELYRLIKDYGEENWAKRIAQFIVNRRERCNIKTTQELVDVINAAIPAAARRSGGHPAKRTFQAIRIEVNGELKILEKALCNFVDCLKPGSRLCVITFHSLEDRIVKRTFKELENPCTCPKEAPRCVCGKKPIIKIINKKPILPTEEECSQNSRARSAKLRVVEKL